MPMREHIKRAVRGLLGGRCYDYHLYRRHHRWLLRHNGFPNRPAEGEAAYIAQWRQLQKHVEPYSYRLFSHFCGPTPDIIPEDVMHSTIELCLNPRDQWDIYEDKNNFARYLSPDLLPRAVASRQAGSPTQWHCDLHSISRPLILKPSVGTSCGESIMRFDKHGSEWVSAEGTLLTEGFLLSYGPDWVLQEAVAQHPDLAQFCQTAVCTVRVVTYRSVADEVPHLTAAVLRVGPSGAVVDNIVAGGRFLGVNPVDGSIKGPFISRFGQRTDVCNGVNIAAGRYCIPCWDGVVALALHVASRIVPHRLLALDITVNAAGKPVLVEYNIGGFTTYLFHFTGQTVLGSYTREVIAHCRQHIRTQNSRW